MADRIPVLPSRKRKRRRLDKSAISARLVLDDHVKGDVGILSEDLFADLFPTIAEENGNGNGHSNVLEFHHVAISPWGPSALVEDSTWTVVPVRASSALAHSTVQFSPSSLALQGFAEALQKVAPSKISSHSRSGIEIRILDVIPLPLETVFVTIEGELARRLENGEGTFHAEHTRTNGLPNGKATPKNPEDHLTAAIREALGSLKVVHTNDLFSLPLPPHPITHIPSPPAKVTLCEPVGQGTLSGRTKIIITQTGHHEKGAKKTAALPVNHALNGVQEDDEDTSNDQFYSAAEDRYKTDTALEDDGSATETEEEQSEENDDLSDDSMDDMISLHAPTLPAHNASGISTIQPGTPRTIGRGRHTGINTPGSVFSTFTSATVRAGGPQGRLFKVQGLMQSLPEAMLHPKPNTDDDEEARVFVDINSLTKIGCFSGDWVRLEAAAEPPVQGGGLWGLGSFGQTEQEDPLWRPVKVFGLPESYSNRPVTRIPSSKQGERRLSFFENQVKKPSSSTVYCSPILLANMENTPYCRIAPLKRAPLPMKMPQPKITSASKPPFARELTLQKISTPFSTERNLQNSLFAGLKQYFASRTRIVRKGDLIGIPIDQELGRTLYQPAGADDLEIEDLFSNTALDDPRPPKAPKVTGVGWFKIGYVGVAKEDEEGSEDGDFWGGVAAIDASSTHMMQSGSENSRLPATMDSTWEYYLGLKSMSKSYSDSTSMPEPRKHHVSALQRRLRELIAAATSPRAIHLQLQPLAILLVSTQRNIGKATMASRASSDIGLHTFTIDAYDVVSEGGQGSDVKTAGLLEARAERAMACGPEFCSLLIRHIEALTADRMMTTLKEIVANARVVIATTTEVDKIPDGVRGLFTHELEMNAPDEWEREGILRGIIDEQSVALAPDVDLSGVAVKTAALVAGDLVDVVDRALVARNTRLENLASSCSDSETPVAVRDVLVAGGPAGRCLTKADFDLAVEAARKNFADAIGAPKIPNVGWDDVGGLTNVKDAVMETIQLPLERPELFAKGMKKRSGILFYGPPGTGKTLLAKAIATEFSLNFFSVKGPELLNMYIGESEANVRRVFQRARDARPCVVFFDELDSVAPKRGNQGDSGGVMDRIVSQLLAELDGMSDGEDGGGGVFVIGATNRPDLLDAALLRPGRFDKMLYLGVSDTHEKQLTIMEALTRKFTLHPSLSLTRVASHLPFTYTGADFYALCSDAMLKAVTRQASLVDSKIATINSQHISVGKPKISTAYFFDHFATDEDVAVMVTEEDFMAAERELVPSVSLKELEHYGRVRAQFEKVEKDDSSKNGKGKGKEVVKDGILDWQRTEEERPRSNGKGKGKEKAVDRKGKGKEKSAGRWDEGSGDEDREFYDERVNGHGHGHGVAKGKGKGKAVDMGFQEGREEDDEELY
ncbi:probable peroxin-6 [Phialocephala subalpina]|uniref:Peroxisomal ATPase PEX6 n=1 Tax=Phialocephala subalpina TaxID=576137 RepID=A0A1L7WMT0_9HELO|nr:probable peroxin-6 [Phialocephala subalpina]